MPTITGNNPKYKHKTEEDREDTIALVAKLARIGLTTQEIALEIYKQKDINISVCSINKYKKLIKERYKQATIESRSEQVLELIDHVKDVRTEAWLRFHQTGDREFLDTVMKTIEQEAKIRGVVEPDKRVFNTMVGVTQGNGQFSWDVLVQELTQRDNVLVIEGNTDQPALPEPSTNGSGYHEPVDKDGL